MKQGRKRFLKTTAFSDFNNWLGHLAELKHYLGQKSGLQIVGNKVYFEINPDASVPTMMLEVLGPPVKLDRADLVLADYEESSLLVYRLLGQNLFNMDYEQLLMTSLGVKQSLAASEMDQAVGLADIFHIVFDNDKIELHFFSQKDYIQKRC